MKYCYFLAALAICQAQGPPDLGSDGVWLPQHVTDLGAKMDVPLLPTARLKFEQNRAARQSETDRRCLPPGVPRIAFMARPFEIVQTANRILFIYEGGGHVWRQAWMDGRAHPKDPNPDWLGDSVGRWEGDTLVVDSVGFNDVTWLDDAGHPHSERLHVVEKYTRTGAGTMRYEVLIDDPGAYTHSWTSTGGFSFRPGGKLEEDICLDKISK